MKFLSPSLHIYTHRNTLPEWKQLAMEHGLPQLVNGDLCLRDSVVFGLSWFWLFFFCFWKVGLLSSLGPVCLVLSSLSRKEEPGLAFLVLIALVCSGSGTTDHGSVQLCFLFSVL